MIFEYFRFQLSEIGGLNDGLRLIPLAATEKRKDHRQRRWET